MIPWELQARVSTPNGRGEMSLHRRGQEYSIRIDGQELMNSRMHSSEERMAELACSALADARRARVLIGGLGMGFTLAAANRCLPSGATIEVAELMPAVIEWNGGPMGELAGRPVRDPRVRVIEGNIRRVLERPQRPYDAIVLDVDNGPEGLTQDSNQWLYGHRGLACIAAALAPGGVLSVWSARPNAPFTRRLNAAGFKSTEHRVAAREKGSGPKHCIWVARRRA